MKKIAIDCRFAPLNAGLGRYTRSVVTRLTHIDIGATYVLLVRSEDEAWLRDCAQGAVILKADFAHYGLGEQIALPLLLRRERFDLLYSPHFNVPLLCPVPFVVTIHDLTLHRFANGAGICKRLAYRSLFDHAVRRARSVIAVSEFTRSELLEHHPRLTPAKVLAIGEAAEENFLPQSSDECDRVRAAFGLKKPFFLYVGNAKEHKNVPLLLDAYRALQDDSTELLLVTGGREAAALSLPQGARIIAAADDRDLPALYSAAECFVTASLREGFCLPVAEAVACGCRVIAPNASAIPEAAAGQAVLVDGSQASLTDALRTIRSAPRPQRTGACWSEIVSKIADILRSSL